MRAYVYDMVCLAEYLRSACHSSPRGAGKFIHAPLAAAAGWIEFAQADYQSCRLFPFSWLFLFVFFFSSSSSFFFCARDQPLSLLRDPQKASDDQ